ncbi:cell division protein FtsZ [Candidatus Falkowbacteria bacterium]|nr:cell division protein FtsZ [Candidatus Falkowbacteria bacterium]
MPEVKPDIETFAKIRVVGIGGSGNAAINRMIRDKIRGVDFMAINTDAQALHHSEAGKKLHIGKNTTKGLGAGMNPGIGRKSAEESQNEIHDALRDSDMIFITCGLGGGTGTGAAPLIADVARDVGALTVAVITKPFSFEGLQRMEIAERGLEELEDKVDTIITIPNDRILQIVDKKTTLLDAFGVVDEVLKQGVQGISEVITIPGLINVDFADVKAVMKDAGSSLMGIGQASGDNRATEAAKMAIDSPLLELSIEGAQGILFTVTGDKSLGMHEVSEAAKVITEMADNEAKIIFGANIDDSLKDEVKITVVATGFAGGVARVTREEEEIPADKLHFFEQKDKKEEDGLKRKVKETLELDEDEEILPEEDKEGDLFQEENKEEEKDDKEKKLDIPAFIRKKMG